jgi:acyl-coenzyme A thioesterase PaaI-like protein
MSATGSSGPQVTHPGDTATTVAATRSLIAALRTADAPVDVLERVAALVDEATDLLASHQVEGMPGQTALRTLLAGAEQFATADPGRFFPYSPVVGPLNAIAPPLTFAFDGERLRGTGALGAPFVGPPGTVHGGVVAMVLDELLGAVNACLGLGAFTGTLTIRYERPTPIATELELESWVERTEGRKVFTVGTIRADGEVTARADGVFIRVDPGALAVGGAG